MAEYQVPQFIEVEDKIFGPLTLKQFIYLAGGAGMCVGLILYLHVIGFVLAVPIAALTLALAFYKMNNKSFTEILESGFNYFLGNRLYLWRKNTNTERQNAPVAAPTPEVRQKLGLSQTKLHDLARSLDIQDQQQPPMAGPTA